MENNTILVIDDDRNILAILELYLKKAGFQVATCADGAMALAAFHETRPALVVLDVMLPGRDGWSVLHDIRMEGETPVIMLTAKGDTGDRVQGLDLGADDYVSKPFDAKELIARIKAVLRRSSAESAAQEGQAIRLEGLEISLSNYEVRVGGRQVDFTPKEVEILYLLASHPGRVFDREQILSKVWGYDYFGDTRAVDTQIKRIRQKMPEDCKWGIRTVYGVGYKFGMTE